MKGQFLKKTIAGLMALLIVSGGMPLQPVSKIFERTAITAKATNIAPTPITGLVAEKNEYGYWKSQALANAGEYDEESGFNYWYSVELLEIYDDTMSDEEKGFEIFEYNADCSYYYTTSVPKGNYPGKYKVYYGISDTEDVENPSSFEVIITKEGTVIPSESVSESGQGASSTEPTGGTGPTGSSEESEESEESAPTIVSTTVENGIYTGFTATSGTTGANTSEGYAKLVDGNKSTKWCVIDPDGTCYVEFNSDISFIPTGYILTTGNDNSKYTGRNPAGWKLYGKLNENDDWTVLAEVTQDTVLEDKDYQSYDFDIENNTSAYQYFRFEFSQTKGSNVFQLSELQFKGEAAEEATDPTEPSSENASEPTETEFESEPSSENTDVITVYFVDSSYWGDVHVYYWGSEESVDWPGTEMKKYQMNDFGQQVYSAEIPANVEGIIFNGNGNQTVDITNNISNGTMWYLTENKDDNGRFEVGYTTETPSESESESTESNSELTETESESEPSSENASEPTETPSESESESTESNSEPTETESESEPAQSLVSVTYLDENGTEQTVDAIPLESGSESYTYLEAGWYVVNSNITYQEVLQLNGDVKLILADNCTMTMTDNAQIYGNRHNLTIYGQTNGTGKLESDISSTCINIVKDYAQYGGIVDLKSKNSWAFNATGDNSGTLTLAGGTLNATSYDIMGSAIAVIVSQDINITGGTLNAVCTSAESSSNTGGHGILISSGNINISGGTVTVNV
ncbi:MAG: starch-binding protein, partial [Oscillospiraceae bacterium]|nr:starch-binding protein [Oscillospiraceae bacterium]